MADLTEKFTPHPDMKFWAEAAEISRDQASLRTGCTTGDLFTHINETTEANKTRPAGMKFPNPPVNEQCTWLLAKSLQTELNPQELAKRPDRSLTAPYGITLEDLNITPTPGLEKSLAGLYVKAAEIAAHNNTKAANDENAPTFAINIAKDSKAQLYLFPGTAFDAGFTQKALQLVEGKARDEKPTRSMTQIQASAAQCFSKDTVAIGECLEAGRDLARMEFHNTKSPTTTAPAPKRAGSKPGL